MLPVPNVDPSPAWADAWDGFELDQITEGRSPKSILNRRYTVLTLARHATAAGHDPADITKVYLTKYLMAQYDGRQGTGAGQVFQHLKVFWDWYAREFEVTSPMAGLKRPKGKNRPVPVVSNA